MSDLTALAEAVGVLEPDDGTTTAGDIVACLAGMAGMYMTLVTGAMLA